MAYGTVNVDAMTTSDGVTSAGTYGFKNRIINGAMTINQRAYSATPSSDGTYTLDRWVTYGQASAASKFSVAQSSTAPSGFINSLLITSTSAYTVGSGDYQSICQFVEGLNVYDLAWGTASASPVTLSFRVYSSLTGTFGGAIQNSGRSRSYPFSYSIPVANTWTTISVTIAGDTSGTWLTDNNVGLRLAFGLGVGSTYSGTAGSWAGTNYWSCTGATSVVGTNGATFYITGVQLEKGSTATSFDYRPYGTEYDLCRRYYEKFDFGSGTSMHGAAQQTNQLECNFIFYPKRTGPSVSVNNGTYYRINDWRGGDEACNGTVNIDASCPTNDRVRLQFQKSTSNLTVGYAGYMNKQGGAAANPMLFISAEL
jgi:hypothetical protein